MEPKNTADRSKAIRNFLIFFIVTVALIVAAVFFSVQVPFKENEQLNKQMEIVNNERDFSKKFERNMNDVMRLFDSLNQKGVDITLTDGKISEKIKTMNSMIDNDSSFAADPSLASVKDLYTNVVVNLSTFHALKIELRDATSKDVSLGELKQENANLKSELSNTKQTLNVYMALASKSN